jgi:hypothetical protein
LATGGRRLRAGCGVHSDEMIGSSTAICRQMLG